jgi:hypothetical protein
VTSALDYGCGKGEQYRWQDPEGGPDGRGAVGLRGHKYDPCYAAFAAEPTGRSTS